MPVYYNSIRVCFFLNIQCFCYVFNFFNFNSFVYFLLNCTCRKQFYTISIPSTNLCQIETDSARIFEIPTNQKRDDSPISQTVS